MKQPLTIREANFLSCRLYTFSSARQPQTCRCLKLGFLLVHNSKGVLGTTLLGTRFNKYIAVFNAYIHKNLDKELLLIILLTISISVLLHLSATPFCSGVYDIVY